MPVATQDDLVYSPLADDPVLGDIVRIYVAEMPERMTALTAAYQTNDRSRLITLAHQIRGSAGSHGFPSITILAGRLEKLARGDAGEAELAGAVEALVDACGRVRCRL